MARPRRIDKELVAKARQVVACTTEVEQLRAAQAVLLPAGWRKVAPDTRHPRAIPRRKRRGKKLPETVAATLNQVDLRGRSVRLMFQDEARFGRMARPRRCWAPLPWRPVMLNGYERQFVYVYGAVSPLQGDLRRQGGDFFAEYRTGAPL